MVRPGRENVHVQRSEGLGDRPRHTQALDGAREKREACLGSLRHSVRAVARHFVPRPRAILHHPSLVEGRKEGSLTIRIIHPWVGMYKRAGQARGAAFPFTPSRDARVPRESTMADPVPFDVAVLYGILFECMFYGQYSSQYDVTTGRGRKVLTAA